MSDNIVTTGKMHPLAAAILAGSADTDTLRELLAVQAQWEDREAKRAYTDAIVALKRDLPATVARDATVDYASDRGRTYYTHTTLAEMVRVVLPALTQHGFSHSWHPATRDGLVVVACRLTHRCGHTEECTISAPPDTSGRKGPAQAIASTITLLERYTLQAILGLATADMAEPHGPQGDDPTVIDPARNARAVDWLRANGHEVGEVEAWLGVQVDGWSIADLDEIRRRFAQKRREV